MFPLQIKLKFNLICYSFGYTCFKLYSRYLSNSILCTFSFSNWLKLSNKELCFISVSINEPFTVFTVKFIVFVCLSFYCLRSILFGIIQFSYFTIKFEVCIIKLQIIRLLYVLLNLFKLIWSERSAFWLQIVNYCL